MFSQQDATNATRWATLPGNVSWRERDVITVIGLDT